MNSDIRIQLNFRQHPKTKKLKFKLGSDGVLSFVWLLMFAAESRSDGRLERMDELDIALASDWDGDPKEFTATLLAIGFLDKDDDTYVIHDWADNNPWAANAKKRSEHARKAVQSRWEKRLSSTENQQLNSKNHTPSIDENTQCNTPSPNPNPNPKPKKEPKSESSIPPCPHSELINLYHETLPELASVLVSRWPGSSGERMLKTRWRENKQHQSLEFWRGFFRVVRTNPHWMGQNDRGWRADLRWLIKRENFDKVVERWANGAAA